MLRRRAHVVQVAYCSSALLALFALPISRSVAQSPPPFAIVPQPVSIRPGTATFTLTPETVIWTDGSSVVLGRRLATFLEPATGVRYAVGSGAAPSGSRIELRRDSTLAGLGKEGYRLEVRPQSIVIRAPEAAGIFYGIQTLRQLLPADIYRAAPIAGIQWTVPAVTIEDSPRFSWRGAHLDVARHFMPKEFVKKFIDLLAVHKLNTFHWHLTDDQGWRVEIRKYPKLTEVGAWRASTLIGHTDRDTTKHVNDGRRHGGFYTQDDIREIVAWAADRFVTVVPEIEMPGHSQAAIAAYPHLGNTGDSITVWGSWGVSPWILSPEESTILFMQDVLAEVLELFPGPFIHIGGDEAVKTQWRASPRAQARKLELGLQNEEQLQSYFIGRMDDFLAARGRRVIGWDEILEGGLTPNAVVMSWRGMAGGIEAARQAHDVVMTPGSHTYFDHYQTQDRVTDPEAWGGFTSLEKVYGFEPVPPELEPSLTRHILGAQAQHWTEYMQTPKRVEYQSFPRLAALAEVLWTPVAQKNYGNFMQRLRAHVARLAAMDVAYRRLD